MKIIAVANQKGGVGKTTTAVNLGWALAEQGRRILIIDLDPQGNATSALGLQDLEDSSLYDCLIGSVSVVDRILPTRHEGLFLVPADLDLAGAEVEIARMSDDRLFDFDKTGTGLAAVGEHGYSFHGTHLLAPKEEGLTSS